MTRPGAISKTEAMNQTSAEVENWLNMVIPAINGMLLNFSAGDSRYIYDKDSGLDELSDAARRRAVEEIKSVCGAKGWKVEREYGDQRSPGNWIKIS